MISRKRIIRFAIGTMMRQDRWEKKYNANHQFDVNQYDYFTSKEYVNALREKWQDLEDPECELEDYVDVSKYSNYDDYACDVVEYKSRLEWRDQWDCDREFDFNPCDFEYEEYYVKALKRAWKKEYDPYDEFAHVDLEWVNDVNEYRNRIDECREWKDEHDPNDEYHVDPSQFDDEEEYVDELRGLWKRKYDYFNEFSSIDPQDYRDEYTYSGAIEDKKYWMKQCDAEGKYSKLDPSYCDNLIQYKHQVNLRKAWKNKYDPNNEFPSVDPCDYKSVEDYNEALKR